jgi:hypothetical protein
MTGFQKQQGLSVLGVLLLAFLVIFFGLLAVKLSGPYYDHMTLNKMIKTSLSDFSASRFDEAQFKDRLQKNMSINNFRIDLKKELIINKRKQPVEITLDYEKRVHLFANVDVVLSFKENYEL